MSYKSSNSPIDIDKESTLTCIEKCDYTFDYGTSSTIISAKRNYYSIKYDSSVSNVVYNSKKLEIIEIRVYSPSLHTYNGVHAIAELVIIHSGFGDNLIVCIPIKIEDNSNNAQIFNILEENRGNLQSNKTSINSSKTWSLNDIVPTKKGFYSYKGNFLDKPGNGKWNYIVWHVEDYGVVMNKKTGRILFPRSGSSAYYDKNKNIIKKGKCYYNKVGAKRVGSDDGEIYIKCSPTGNEGKVLYTKGIKKKMSISTDLLSNPAIEIFIGFISAYIIFKVGDFVYKKMRK